MTPIVFINSKQVPFIWQIMNGKKLWETRNRDTLCRVVGKRVFLAETGNGKPVVRCSAELCRAIPINNPDVWDGLREDTCIPVGNKYDWKPETKVKYIYFIRKVQKVKPFSPPEGKRHGRVWMEYEEE